MFSAQHKFGRLGAPAGRSLDAAIRALFPDVWYDPSDFTTLFQDAAGTTPVTALEQPVGLMLDKSRGLVLGSEIVGAASPSVLEPNWTNNGSGSYTSSGTGYLRFTGLTIGKTYKITFVVSSYTSGTLFGFIKSSWDWQLTSATTYTAILVAGGTLVQFFGNSFVGTIQSISVRELPGVHAFHTPGDTTTRPTVSRRINLLTKTEVLNDSAWLKVGAQSVLADQVIAPDGTQTADKLRPSAASDLQAIYQQQTFAATSYSFSVSAKAAEYSWLFLRTDGVTNRYAWFNLSSGATGTTAAGLTATISQQSNGFYRCTVSWTSLGGSGNVLVGASNADNVNTFAGDGTSGIYIWGASLVPADLSSLPYQRVNTTTDYDSDASKFPTFLRTDGVNDSLQTNAIDFSSTDKMFVGAAVRKLSDAAIGMISEFSADSNGSNGTFMLFVAPSGPTGYYWRSKGTIAADVGAGTFVAPRSDVISGIGDISQKSSIARVNGTALTPTTTSQGTGNFGNHKLYLFIRGGTNLPFNGWFFGSLIKGATLTASQIALAERWLASKTKTVSLA